MECNFISIMKEKSDPWIKEGENGVLKNWHKWNKFRLMCDQHHRLGVVIRLTENVPIEYKEDYKRWTGEPVRGIIIPKSIFRFNKRFRL